MTTNEIRKKFLDFFKSKKHSIIASDSLVPKDDPTVLFTTAGMQQFKRQFLGFIDDTTRAATSQKCLRTDDLDKVGKTAVHHTFFEMLGNFSFGDYFKKEAIAWAWEFLTQELKIPAEKLWVSVYKDDAEAKAIWINDIKIPKERVVALGDHSNFWPADAKEKGPNGPCGPCSEIFFDYGYNPACQSKVCDPDCSCGRFSEIWNLVFTQYNRKDGGILEPLPSKNIDTGMGLERLVAVIQGKKNNFETDIFAPIFKAIDKEIDRDKKVLSAYQRNVIADHIRAIVFGISDEVIPSNEGRGYVIKKLIIDITDHVLQSGRNEATIYKLVPAVVEAMGEPYPEIKKNASHIQDVIRNVEESYIRVRKEKIPELKNDLKKYQTTSLTQQAIEAIGKTIFLYRDTHGLTLPTISTIALSSGLVQKDIDKALVHFDTQMKEQQEKSRAGSKMIGDVFTGADIKLDVPKTEFLGYDHNESSSKILRLFLENQEINTVSAGNKIKVVLDKTPFYAEQGGQVGDTGILTGPAGKIRIEDTQKISDIYIHSGVVEEGSVKEGGTVQAKIDANRRADIMKNHTATHLLQAALREILGSHVKQQGSLVAPDRLRFDFAHPKAVKKEELDKIENRVNEIMQMAVPVETEILDIDEAKKKGALAFFAEKYGKTVRVISIGNVSKEFCGGTHLKNTKNIENFKITSESAVAQGIRRLEAKTGKEALDFMNKKEAAEREKENLANLRALEEQKEKKRYAEIVKSLDKELKNIPEINGTKFFTRTINNMRIDTLKRIADFVKQTAKSSAIILSSRENGNATILITLTDDLVNKGLNANEIVKTIAPLMNGSGGGRPQMAQAGSKDIQLLEGAIQKANELIMGKIKK